MVDYNILSRRRELRFSTLFPFQFLLVEGVSNPSHLGKDRCQSKNVSNPALGEVQSYPSNSPQKFDRFNRHEISQNHLPTLLQLRFPLNSDRPENSVIFCGS